MFLGQVPFHCKICKNEYVENIWDNDGICYVKYENKWFKAEYDGYGEYTIQKTKQSIFSAKAICIRCYKALKKKID